VGASFGPIRAERLYPNPEGFQVAVRLEGSYLMRDANSQVQRRMKR
jgi:hypothetical protein